MRPRAVPRAVRRRGCREASRRSWRCFRTRGVLAAEPAAAPMSAQEQLLAAFERHLLGERALAASTAAAHVARARRFLAGLPRRGLTGLTAADVTRAALAETEMVSAGSAQYLVAALRAFLRFSFLVGLTGAALPGAPLAETGP